MNVPTVFAEMDRFGFVHHRALNSPEAFRAAASAAGGRPDLVHVLEGDLCWHWGDGRRTFYFRHPRLLTDVLKPDAIDRARAAGRLVLLEDVLAEPTPGLRYIIELKAGVGDREQALSAVIGLLEEGCRGRYWFDGFSLRLLATVKRINPAAPTSLHTKLVLGPWVLRTAPEFFPVSLHRIDRLSQVDAVTLTYTTSLARWLRPFGATIDGTCRAVTEAGKTLILGGLTSPERFELARRSVARAGYAKFPLSAALLSAGRGDWLQGPRASG